MQYMSIYAYIYIYTNISVGVFGAPGGAPCFPVLPSARHSKSLETRKLEKTRENARKLEKTRDDVQTLPKTLPNTHRKRPNSRKIWI